VSIENHITSKAESLKTNVDLSSTVMHLVRVAAAMPLEAMWQSCEARFRNVHMDSAFDESNLLLEGLVGLASAKAHTASIHRRHETALRGAHHVQLCARAENCLGKLRQTYEHEGKDERSKLPSEEQRRRTAEDNNIPRGRGDVGHVEVADVNSVVQHALETSSQREWQLRSDEPREDVINDIV